VKLLRWLFARERHAFASGRLLFFDESGINLSMARAYARADRGERAVGHVPKNWGESMTIAAGIGLRGLVAPLLMHGSMNGEVFEAYFEQFVIPELREGDIVVLDNLGAHKLRSVAEMARAVGVQLLFLPPYSPDLNPIELAWSKVKAILRSHAARTYEDLENAVVAAMSAICVEDILGWFRHCGY
jgi:transposase